MRTLSPRFFVTTLSVLAFVLLSWQQPELANAQRVRGKTARTSARAKTAKRVKARAGLGTRIKTASKSRAKKTAKGFASLTRSPRASVKTKNAAAKTAVKEGQLSAAAAISTRSGARNAKGQFTKGGAKLTIRERFSNWRATRAVRKAAFSQAKSRSKKGNLEGTADALAAVNTLQAAGKLGLFGKWKKARLTRKVFNNIKSSARKSLKSGDVDGATQSFLYATGIKPGSKAATKLAKTLVKDSFKLAKSFSKAGQADLSWSILNMASGISAEANIKFSEKKAQTIIDSAFKNAVPAYTKMAKAAYKRGEIAQSVSYLAEARSIVRGGTVKPSRSVMRAQAKLVKNLGPALTSFEAAQAAQSQPAAQPDA